MCPCTRMIQHHYTMIIFFRDHGISFQILMYQCFTEIAVFLLTVILMVLVSWDILPNHWDILVSRIIILINTTVIFVIQPLFYLNGDVNFRNRVINQGLYAALKNELFQSNAEFQRVEPTQLMPSLNTIAPIPSVNEEVLPRETHENQNEEMIETEPFPITQVGLSMSNLLMLARLSNIKIEGEQKKVP